MKLVSILFIFCRASCSVVFIRIVVRIWATVVAPVYRMMHQLKWLVPALIITLKTTTDFASLL